jgi:hypothetical protein
MAAVDWARVLSCFSIYPNPLFDHSETQSHVLVEPAKGWFRGIIGRQKTVGKGKIKLSVPDFMEHNGAFAGCFAYGFWRSDGLVCVVTFNTDVAPPDLREDLLKRLDKMTAWPSGDHFPAVGITWPD